MRKPDAGRRARRRFSTEFKDGAVRLVLDEGKTIGAVARELDLTPSALGLWVRQRSQGRRVCEQRGSAGRRSGPTPALRRAGIHVPPPCCGSGSCLASQPHVNAQRRVGEAPGDGEGRKRDDEMEDGLAVVGASWGRIEALSGAPASRRTKPSWMRRSIVIPPFAVSIRSSWRRAIRRRSEGSTCAAPP